MKKALQALIDEMEYVLSCINEDKIPFDGDDFHEALRLGKKALSQTENDKERCVGCEACIDTACGRDECPKGWPKAAQPEQEPSELLLRGILASELKCWHRLTADEAENLVHFVQKMGSKLAQPEHSAPHWEPVTGEPAPENSLPTWSECNLIIENDEFRKRAEAGLEGQVLDTPRTTPKPTALHYFIHEYDDAAPYRSAWFLHRLECVLKEATTPPQRKPLTDEQLEKGRGQTFSINNPFCPCDSKTFRKVARWVEAAHDIKG